jgi:hypothetical protein
MHETGNVIQFKTDIAKLNHITPVHYCILKYRTDSIVRFPFCRSTKMLTKNKLYLTNYDTYNLFPIRNIDETKFRALVSSTWTSLGIPTTIFLLTYSNLHAS